MHPTAERWHLVERLDTLFWAGFFCVCVVSLILWLVAKRYKIKWVERCDWVLELVLVTALGGYLIWRFCFAWKGIYYP